MQAASLSDKRWVPWVALCLLVLHFGIAVGSKVHNSVAADELVHYSAGFSYWHYNDYRLHPENGNLPQRWAALPAAALSDAGFPSHEAAGWTVGGAWSMGYEFFYQSGNDHFPLLMTGRAMIALLSVATGLLVFLWSRQLYGDKAALFSLVLYCFSPDTLAHGALVTSDMAATLAFLLSLGLYWRHLHDGGWRLLLLSSLCFGVAWVTKYSAVILLPVFGFLALLRCLDRKALNLGSSRSCSFPGKAAALSASLLVHATVAAGVIWLFYGFRYSASNPLYPPAADFSHSWSVINRSIGTPGILLSKVAELRLLPEAFLYGFAYVLETIRQRAAFLNGEYSTTGWPSFFLFTFLYKTPLSLFLILLGVTLVHLRSWLGEAAQGLARLREELHRIAPLVCFLLVYWVLSITSHLNIGHRHLLPIYPVLFILCGALFAPRFTQRAGVRPALKWTLAGIFALEALLVFPNFLSYYNPIAGGPANGWRHLVDSSTDWGQNMPQLANWLRERRAAGDKRPAFLSYFGSCSPNYYGIVAERLPCETILPFPRRTAELKPGIYCISATMLQQVYSPYSGPWSDRFEESYLALLPPDRLAPPQAGHTPRNASLSAGKVAGSWDNNEHTFDQLRFARLCHYLRARGPDEVLGGSILIFSLDELELNRALLLPLGPWRAWIDQVHSKD